MKTFDYVRPATVREAVAAASAPGAAYLAAGTNLLDLMKLEIEQPTHLIDISRLPLKQVEERPDPDRSAGGKLGRRRRSSSARALPSLGGGTARRCLGPATKQGIHRRQSPAAYALPVFLRHRSSL